MKERNEGNRSKRRNDDAPNEAATDRRERERVRTAAISGREQRRTESG
jgi:hypothetical protein